MLSVTDKFSIICNLWGTKRSRFQFCFNHQKQGDFSLSAGKCKDYGNQPIKYERNYRFCLISAKADSIFMELCDIGALVTALEDFN